MRASSWNQISIGLWVAMLPRWALSVAGKFFFEHVDRAGILHRMTRSGAHVREAELLENLANRALMVGDAEALGDETLKINAPPAHDPASQPTSRRT